MRFIAVLNRDGGTLRTIDLDGFQHRMTATMERAGHEIAINVVSGSTLEKALVEASESQADVVMAGGGDGKIGRAHV